VVELLGADLADQQGRTHRRLSHVFWGLVGDWQARRADRRLSGVTSIRL